MNLVRNGVFLWPESSMQLNKSWQSGGKPRPSSRGQAGARISGSDLALDSLAV